MHAEGDRNGVDAYMASIPDGPRAVLEQIRQTIRAAAPEVEETIAYDMPAFRLAGRFLVSFAAYKNHCSLFPASGAVIDACGDELRTYLSGKATIRFQAAQPLPAALVRRIVRILVAEVESRTGR